jgi:hypothetical protein
MSKKYKTWGNYAEQTVSKDRNSDHNVVIRSGSKRIYMEKNEIDSLIVALLTVKNNGS